MKSSGYGNQSLDLAAASGPLTASHAKEVPDLNSPDPFPASLPAKEFPLLVIEPRKAWTPPDVRGLWQYRELLYFLTWRDIKVRYKQTLLGAAWAIIQPLFTMIIFTLFFGRLAKVQSDGIPYPLFAYAGLMPWTFFAGAITNSGNSLIGSAHLVTKVYFPRMIIPAAAVLAGLVDFGIAFLVFVPLLIWYHVPMGTGLLLLPVLVLTTAVFALGVGMWLAALNVKYRDIRYAIPFLIQIWMFVTPLIYPSSLMPSKYRLLYSLNPMAGIIEAFRAAMLGGVNGAGIDWRSLGLACIIALTLLIYAAYHFRRTERVFADFI